MPTIAIVPDNPQGAAAGYRAIAGEVQTSGATVGQALDALRSQLGGAEQTTLIVVQPMRPDDRFTAVQQQRLTDLLARWRTASDSGTALPPKKGRNAATARGTSKETAAGSGNHLSHRWQPW